MPLDLNHQLSQTVDLESGRHYSSQSARRSAVAIACACTARTGGAGAGQPQLQLGSAGQLVARAAFQPRYVVVSREVDKASASRSILAKHL
jgi:hypothetical protein